MVAMVKNTDKIAKLPETEIVMITPAMATAWLEESKFDNRRLDDYHVDKICRDIKAGKWIFDGNPIRFDKEGNIIDGQHRLWAVITAGKPVKSAVIRELDHDAVNIIDTGKSRSNADILHFNGQTNCTSLSAAARLYIGYRTNGRDMKKWAQGNAHKRLSVSEILKEIKISPGLPEAVSAFRKHTYAAKITGTGVGCFCHYIFSKIDHLASDEFFHLVNSGADLHEGSPILALRNWLVVKDYRGTKGGNLQTMIKVAIIIKTWNAWRKRKNVQRLKYDTEREEYPIPE